MFNALKRPATPLKTEQELAEEASDKELQDWMNDYKEWCKYNVKENRCLGHKVLESEDDHVIRLLNIFNQELLNHEYEIEEFKYPEGFIAKLNKLSKFFIKAQQIDDETVDKKTYYIKEADARNFLETYHISWSTYTANNKHYKYCTTTDKNKVKWVILDAFVYGFYALPEDMVPHKLKNASTVFPNQPRPSKQYPPTTNSTVPNRQPNTNMDYTYPPIEPRTTVRSTAKSSLKTFANRVAQYGKKILPSKKTLNAKPDKIFNNQTFNAVPQPENKNKNKLNAMMQKNPMFVDDDDEDEEYDKSLLKKLEPVDMTKFKTNRDGIIHDPDLDGGKRKRPTSSKKATTTKRTSTKPTASSKKATTTQRASTKTTSKKTTTTKRTSTKPTTSKKATTIKRASTKTPTTSKKTTTTKRT